MTERDEQNRFFFEIDFGSRFGGLLQGGMLVPKLGPLDGIRYDQLFWFLDAAECATGDGPEFGAVRRFGLGKKSQANDESEQVSYHGVI